MIFTNAVWRQFVQDFKVDAEDTKGSDYLLSGRLKYHNKSNSEGSPNKKKATATSTKNTQCLPT